MTAELIAHRREKLVLELVLVARAEALVKGGGENGREHVFVDRRLDRPAPFAGWSFAPPPCRRKGALRRDEPVQLVVNGVAAVDRPRRSVESGQEAVPKGFTSFPRERESSLRTVSRYLDRQFQT